jgi:zinc protease
MKTKVAARALAILVAGLAPTAASEPARKAAEKQVTYLPSASSPLVAIRVSFRAGSEDDPPGKEGLAALTAKLVAEGGTKELTYEQVLAKLYPMSASVSERCLKEITVFSGVVHRENLAKYEPILAAMLTTPRFATEDFERLRNEAVDYLSKTLRGGNDEELGKWTLQLMLFPKHPYGHVDAGTVQGLKAITLEDVKEFYKKHYVQAEMRLGVAGGVDETFVEKLRSDLDPLADSGDLAPMLPDPVIPKNLDVTIVEKPADSTAISIGFPLGINRSDEDFYALAVANSYLGEHRTFNGKLMQDLRGKRGLNYGDYSYIEDFVQDGPSTFPVPNNPRRQQAFTIWVRPVPHDKAAFALRAALWELDRLTKDGMSAGDFEATRSFLLNYSKLWIQTLSRRLGVEMDGPFYDREDVVTELANRLPTLTVEQVNSAVKRHLKAPGARIAIVTRDAAGLRDQLLSGRPTPLKYDTQGTPGDVLAEDKIIAAFPLNGMTVRIVPAAEMFEN